MKPRKSDQLVDLAFLHRSLALFATALFFFAQEPSAKSSGCSCSPCTCSPCHCGGGHHSRVGVGVNFDLGGVNKRELNPFSVSDGAATSSQTQEKQKPKTKETDVVKFNPFIGVKLTGGQAKGVALADSSYRSSGNESAVNLNGTVGALIPSERKESKSKP